MFSAGNTLYIDSDRIPVLPRWKEVLNIYAGSDKAISHIIPGHMEYLDRQLLIDNRNARAQLGKLKKRQLQPC